MHGYDPDTDQHEADWLAAEHDAGSVPEYGYGLRVGIGGKLLHEYSMIRSELPHRMRNDPPDRHVLTTASRDPSSNRRRPRGCGSPYLTAAERQMRMAAPRREDLEKQASSWLTGDRERAGREREGPS